MSIIKPTLDHILEMKYPDCATVGFQYGYFSHEVAKAMITTKRKLYMTPEMKTEYKKGHAIQLYDGQTMSQPGFVGHMLTQLDIQPGDRVKEIGSGSCRALAQVLQLTGPDGLVTGVERNKKMFDLGKHNIEKNFGGIPKNLELIHGDGLQHNGEGLYDKILFSAAFSPKQQGREQIAHQLTIGGKIIYPQFTHKVGMKEKSIYLCQLSLLTKKLDNKRGIKNLGECCFVPVVSEGKGPDGEII